MAAPYQPGDDSLSALVRPYTLTRGRTRPRGDTIPVEAIVCQRGGWRRSQPDLRPVEAEIYRLAGERLSAAEMSHRLRLPLGVVRVLIGDLVASGHLLLGPTALGGDIPLIRRLIHGLRAL